MEAKITDHVWDLSELAACLKQEPSITFGSLLAQVRH